MSLSASPVDPVIVTPEEIKALRASLGLTQRQLAVALGLKGRRALNTVYRWERGIKIPSPASSAALRQLMVERGLQ